MTSIGSPSPFFLAGKKAYAVDRSLRFNRADSTYVTRSVSSTGNRKTWTVSFWMKFCGVTLNNSQRLWSNDSGNGSGDILKIEFDSGSDSNRRLSVIDNNHAGSGIRFVGDRRFRDPSAWYHIVLAVDTTQATATNRVKIYVNNEQVSDWKSGSEHNHPPDQNYDTCVNLSGKSNTWGRSFSFGNSSADHFDGYLAEINFIDGFQYDPSYFGETNVITGQWNPKKYVGSYGTNGYYLNFSDNSGTTATTLGKDSSGNGNNFTPNNFSVAAGAGNDSVQDTPTNNFCTLNAIALGQGNEQRATLSNGNLDFTESSSSNRTAVSTFGLKTGKWYFEFLSTNTGTFSIGWHDMENNQGSFYRNNGYYSSSFGGGGASGYASWTTNDIVGVAIDFDSGKIWYAKNNTWQSGDPATGNSPTNTFTTGRTLHTEAFTDNSSGTKSGSFNYGQRPFTYTPPTGYKSMCSANLPDPAITLPNKHFGIILYTGNGSSQSISDSNAVNFKPDWIWFKKRNEAESHHLSDSVRGANKRLISNSNAAETTDNNLTSFDNNGFTISGTSGGSTNDNSDTYVAWNWNGGDTDGKTYTVKVHNFSGNNRYIFDDFQTEAVTIRLAKGGTYIFNMDDSSNASHPFSIGTAANVTVYAVGTTYFLDGVSKSYADYTSGFYAATTRRLHITVPANAPVLYYWCSNHSGMGGQIDTNSDLGSSNFDGTIQSLVKVNTTAGFSIITWTGNQTSGATLGHGLGVAPKIAFVKRRDGTGNWIVPFFDLQTAGKLNDQDAFTNNYYNVFFTSQPSSTLLTIGSNDDINRNTSTYVAYVFSEVAGYSKRGNYTGNGSSSGPFVFTGFRPAWVIIKQTGQMDWVIDDTTRSPFNESNATLFSNLNDAEYTGGAYGIDFYSNGFRPLNTYTQYNANGGTYIYLAFAESPFKNARAR